MNKSFKDCVTSSLFILNVIYFGVLCLRLNYFMSSYVSWITDLCFRILPDCFSGRFSIKVGPFIEKNLKIGKKHSHKCQSTSILWVSYSCLKQLHMHRWSASWLIIWKFSLVAGHKTYIRGSPPLGQTQCV